MDKTEQLFTTEKTMKDWSDKDWNKFHDWLKGILTVSEVNVTFTKKDGTDRVMRCTLNPEQLPKVELIENKKERKKSEGTVAVFDLEKNAWRSFQIRSVKQVRFDL